MNDPTTEALLAAIESQDLAAVQQHIKDGAEVNASSYYGGTSLHRAVYLGNVEIVKLLLEARANPSTDLCNWGLPIDVAIKFSRTGIAALLIAHGSPESNYTSGRSPAYSFPPRVEALETLLRNSSATEAERHITGLLAKGCDVATLRVCVKYLLDLIQQPTDTELEAEVYDAKTLEAEAHSLRGLEIDCPCPASHAQLVRDLPFGATSWTCTLCGSTGLKVG